MDPVECPELVDSLEEPLLVLDLEETMDLPSRKSIKLLDLVSLSLASFLLYSTLLAY